MMTQGFDGTHFAILAASFFVSGWLLFRRIDKQKGRPR